MDDSTPDNVVTLQFGKPQAPVVSPLVEHMRTVFEEFLQAGIVAVVLDTRVAQCQVPQSFQGDPQLVLNFAYAYRVPDFGFDDQGIFATLTFPEGFFYCFIPWESISSMHSEALKKSAIWKLQGELTPETPAPEEPAPEEPKPKKHHLTLVKD